MKSCEMDFCEAGEAAKSQATRAPSLADRMFCGDLKTKRHAPMRFDPHKCVPCTDGPVMAPTAERRYGRVLSGLASTFRGLSGYALRDERRNRHDQLPGWVVKQ
jgi:hypothetical protein